jgi:hypothetical protein
MTSNTECTSFAYTKQPLGFSSQGMNAQSPFKLSHTGTAAFKPLQAAKPGNLPSAHSDLHGKRIAFQLVAKNFQADKENAPPTLAHQKKRFQEKIVKNIAQNMNPPTEAGEAQFPDTSKNSKTFSLRQFNSILLGGRPRLEFKARPRGSVFQIKSSKPTHCSVTVKGLTIQVKIAN